MSDGDGLIIQNRKDAVAEEKPGTRICLRPANKGGGAAVGMFNWYFQMTLHSSLMKFNDI